MVKKTILCLALIVFLCSATANVIAESDNEPCEFTNCACKFFLDDDDSRGFLMSQCRSCVESGCTDPVSCTACLSWAAGLSIGCRSFNYFYDTYYSGTNYCSAQRVAINLGLAAMDIVGAGESTSAAMDVFEFASEASGPLVDWAKGQYADIPIDCSQAPKKMPDPKYRDLVNNPWHSPHLTYTTPRKPAPDEPIVFTTRIFNMGQQLDIYGFIASFDLYNHDTNILIETKRFYYTQSGSVLHPRQYVDATITFNPQPKGNYTIRSLVDDGNSIVEEDVYWGTSYEDNNEDWYHFEISDFKGADLAVRDVLVDPPMPLEGVGTIAKTKIGNVGHYDISVYKQDYGQTSYIRCFLDENIIDDVNFEQLAPGQTKDYGCSIPQNTPAGQHVVKIAAGITEGDAAEEDITNNEQQISFSILPKMPAAPRLAYPPILSRSSATLTWDPIIDIHVKKIEVYYKEGAGGIPNILAGTITDTRTNQYVVEGLQPNKYYSFMVRATNDHPQQPQSADSNIVAGSTNSSVSISFISPAEGSILSGNVPLSVQVDDPENKIGSVDFEFDNPDGLGEDIHGLIGNDTNKADGWGMAWNSTIVPYSLSTKIKAYARVDRFTSYMAAVSAGVDNNPEPIIELTTGGTVSGQISPAATTKWLEYDRFEKISFFYSAPGGAETEIGSVPKTDYGSGYFPVLFGWHVKWDTTAVTDGKYNLTAKIMNGNTVVKQDSNTIVVDNFPDLLLSLEQPAPASTSNGTITLRAKTENLDHYPSVNCVDFRYVGYMLGDHSLGVDSVKNNDIWEIAYDTRNICGDCSVNFYVAAKNCQTNEVFAQTPIDWMYYIKNEHMVFIASFTSPKDGQIVYGAAPVKVEITQAPYIPQRVDFEICSVDNPNFGVLGTNCLYFIDYDGSDGWGMIWYTDHTYQGIKDYPDGKYYIGATIGDLEIKTGTVFVNNANPPPPPGQGTPDFTVSTSKICWIGYLVPGNTIKLYADAINVGTAAGGPRYRICMKDPAMNYPKTMMGGAGTLPEIGIRDAKRVETSWTIPGEGIYIWRAAVDPNMPVCSGYNSGDSLGQWNDNRYDELDESNNIYDCTLDTRQLKLIPFFSTFQGDKFTILDAAESKGVISEYKWYLGDMASYILTSDGVPIKGRDKSSKDKSPKEFITQKPTVKLADVPQGRYKIALIVMGYNGKTSDILSKTILIGEGELKEEELKERKLKEETEKTSKKEKEEKEAAQEQPVDNAPTAIFRVRQKESMVLLDAGKSFDIDGAIKEFVWDLGGLAGQNVVRTDNPVLNIKRAAVGKYRISLVVVDDKGMASEKATENIVVGGAKPGEQPAPKEQPVPIMPTAEDLVSIKPIIQPEEDAKQPEQISPIQQPEQLVQKEEQAKENGGLDIFAKKRSVVSPLTGQAVKKTGPSNNPFLIGCGKHGYFCLGRRI